MKNLIKIFLLTIFFTVVIYYINYNFFLDKENNIETNIAEEKYIDTQKINNKILNNLEKKELIEYIKKISFYKIIFKPSSFKKENNYFEKDIKQTLENLIFKNKIKNLQVIINKDKFDRRGNMKLKTINLYGLNKEKENEYLSVFIHELGHYIDIYFLEKAVFLDISEKFYKISWEKTKIKRKGQEIKDFVSGYAMTNKYEDFAESFNFYILHNKNFLQKSKKSKILKEKYDFFSNYLFKNKEFFAKDFSQTNYKNYYWDTTKILYDKQKFFSYLKSLNK